MIDISVIQDLISQLNIIIETLEEHEDECCVALEVGHQLRDELELLQAISEEEFE